MSYNKAIRVLKKDPKMRKIVSHVGECKITVVQNKYEALVNAIVTQQISDAAGRAIINRFKMRYRNRFPKPIQVINTSDADLRKIGLSKMKIQYIRGISELIYSKQINFRKFTKMNDEDIISELIKIRGIGRWTAEMFLIFGLDRLDVLPVGDLGLRNGIRKMYFEKTNPNESDLLEIAEK